MSPLNQSPAVSLLISESRTNTLGNKTGTWRFVRPKFQEKTAPCRNACPLGVDIARVEMLVAQKAYHRALNVLLTENPFPAICGRVCFHPCETACNRQHLDQAVGIHHIERFIGNQGVAENDQPEYPLLNHKKIAIIGAGPAGLAVAYFARCLGYASDIYEKSEAAGGLLKTGIPTYRLPENILHAEIKRLNDEGIQFFFNQAMNIRDLNDIRNDYEAIFLCCGDALPIKLKIIGGEHAHDGLKVLQQIRSNTPTGLTGRIAVIGGGNTAIDVARSLMRQGTHPIIVYRRSKKDMPAHPYEIRAALDEGIQLKECFSPTSILTHNKRYVLTLQGMKPDKIKEGRQTYVPDNSRTDSLAVDHVVSAIGAEMDLMWHSDQSVNLSHCRIKGGETPIFWCGDLAAPEKTVTHALASGKQAVIAMDILQTHDFSDVREQCQQYQVGTGPAISFAMYARSQQIVSENKEIVHYEKINTHYFDKQSAFLPNQLAIEDRKTGFAEVVYDLAPSQASNEASRCFNCGICNDCDICRIFCPEMAIHCQDCSRYILMDYCKGCGICFVECPRNAMNLEVEP